MVGDHTGALVEGDMEGGDIGVTEEGFWVPGDLGPIQGRQEAARAVAAADTEDSVDRGVKESVLEVGGALGVVSGEVAVVVTSEAGGEEDGFQAQGADGVDRGFQVRIWHSGGGAQQGCPASGLEGFW